MKSSIWKLIIFIILAIKIPVSYAQTFSNIDPEAANSWNAVLEKEIVVSGVTSPLGGGNFELIQVNLHMGSQADGTCNYSRYNVTLTSPAGTQIHIVNGNPNLETYTFPNSNVREFNCKFRDNQYLRYPSGGSGSMSEPWHIGYYRTRDSNAFGTFSGEDPNGTWTLRITENSVAQGARFNRVDLVFSLFDYVDYTSFSDNDDCATPYCLRSSEIVIGTNEGYTPQATDMYNPNTVGCDWNAAQNNSAWFMFVADEPNVHITISGITANLQILGIASGGNQCLPGTNTVVAGGCPADPINDTYLSPRYSNGSTNNNQLNMSGLTPAETYYFIVDGTGGAVSPFYIEISGANDTCSDVITPPSEITAIINITSDYNGQDISCYGASDASAIVIASDGDEPYTYQWDANAGNQTTAEATNLSSGTYTVTVTDDNGATTSASIVVPEPDEIIINLSISNGLLCFGDSNGEIQANISGGTDPYSYEWENTANPGVIISTASSIDNLPSGTYQLNVLDANDCFATASITITEPDELIASATFIDIDCFGENSQVTVTASGGTLPYTGTGTFVVPAGTHNYLVTDDNGCTDDVTVVIDEPTELTGSVIALVNQNCLTTGSAQVEGSGGTTPYTYNWPAGAGGVVGGVASNLTVGTYTVTIADDNGCGFEIEINIIDEGVLSANSTLIADVSCFGGNDGAVQIEITDGDPDFTIIWSSGSQTSSLNNVTISNLSAGSYTFTVTDSNDCSEVTTIVINQASELTASIQSISNQICLTNGSATISANGGTPPYSYVWPASAGGVVDNTANDLTTGQYIVTIYDNNSCSTTQLIDIQNTGTITLNNSISSGILCNGDTNGKITLTITDGTADYTITWSTGSVLTNQNSQEISGLSAGTYVFTVTDINGCEDVSIASLSEPPVLSSDITALADQICLSPGSATIAGLGGSPPYSYTWSAGAGGISGGTANILNEGFYEITITDSNNCETIQTLLIEDVGELNAIITNHSDPLCHGDANASISILLTDGNPQYSIDWGTGSTTSMTNNHTITNLSHGFYSITVSDANSCQDIVEISLDNPPILTAEITDVNNQYCANLGSATISANGGTTPYQFHWPPNAGGVNNNSANELSEGTYIVTINDSNNCETTQSITIQNINNLSISIDGQHISCYGGNDGSAEVVSISGADYPVFYEWNQGSINPGISGLGAGTYNVTVTDNNSCQAIAEISLNEPSEIQVQVVTNDANCNGTAGTSTLSSSGGTPPYNYLWPDNSISNFNNNLQPGNYIVSITDANNCLQTAEVNISLIGSIAVQISQTSQISCFGYSDAALSSSATGNSPFNYNWSNGSSSQNISNIPAGQYSVTVTDNWGCTGEASYTVSQVSEINPIFTRINVSCYNYSDGAASVVANGGNPPYTYIWSTGVQGSQISNLTAGTYSVSITDSNQCTAVGNISVVQPSSELQALIDFSDLSCFGSNDGRIISSAIGGTPPYSYFLQSQGFTSNSSNLTGIPAGEYHLQITDAANCTLQSEVYISQPSDLILDFYYQGPSCIGNNDGFIEFNVTGGTKPYIYSFEQGTSSLGYIEELYEGVYNFTVTDANNCTKSTGVMSLIDNQEDCLRIPNAYTPNGDGINDTWIIEGREMFPNGLFTVFNRWGQIVYQARGSEPAWDGTWNGKFVPTGSYIYTIELFNRTKKYVGIVTVVY